MIDKGEIENTQDEEEPTTKLHQISPSVSMRDIVKEDIQTKKHSISSTHTPSPTQTPNTVRKSGPRIVKPIKPSDNDSNEKSVIVKAKPVKKPSVSISTRLSSMLQTRSRKSVVSKEVKKPLLNSLAESESEVDKQTSVDGNKNKSRVIKPIKQ